MLNLMNLLVGVDSFIPHGHCYLWRPGLLGLHIVGDALIALAYYSIPLTLFYVVRRRQDLPFTWVFLLFSAFIVACGTTHLLAIWTLWYPAYWLSGSIKLLTAAVSVVTAVLLVPIVPKALALPSPAALEIANWSLQQEIIERQRIEQELIRSRDLREAIFHESADALFLVDPQTLLTLDCNRRAIELFQAADQAELIGIAGNTLQRHPFSPDELSAISIEMASQGFWSREVEYVTRQDHVFWGHTAAKHITVVDQTMSLVRVTDISERKRSEAEREQAELSAMRLAAIVESSGDAIIGESLDGTITSWNLGAEKILGYKAAAIVGRPNVMLVPPDCLDELSRVLEQVKQGETIESYETVRLRQDGQRVNIAATVSPVKDATGQVIGISKIGRDITARKRAEAELLESEARFQAFMNNSPAASWVTDADGQMFYISPTYARVFPTPGDAIGRSIFELFPAKIAANFHRNIRQAAETGQTVSAIENAPRIDGTLGKFLVYQFPLNELSGRSLVGGIAVDITEREQAKEQLRSLNDRLQYLLSHAPVAIFSCKAGGDYGATSMSENITALFGYEPQSFLEDSSFWVNHIHPDDRGRVLADAAQIFVSDHHAHEYRFLHADGTYRWVYNQLQLMRDERGQATEIIGYLVDISDRKHAEAAVQQSEARYRAIVEDQTELIVRFQPDGVLTFVNGAYCRYFGIAQEHTIGHRYAPVVLAEDRERVAQLVASMNQAHPTVTIENRVVVRGEVRWMQWNNRALFDAQGHLSEIQAVGRDIHDRKQAEQALQEREAFLRAIGDNIPNGYLYQLIREADGRYRYTYVSAGLERVSGLKPDAVLADSSLMFQLVLEDDLPEVLRQGEASAQQLSVFDMQVRERLPDGNTRWLRLCATPRRLDDGRVVWDGIRLDIDDLKRTEASLRQSEERWQMAVSGSNDGIWDHDLQTNQHYLSPRCLEIAGYAYDEVDTFETWFQRIHPADVDRVKATFREHVEQHRPNYACEYRMQCKDGSTKWLLTRGQILWDEHGKPLRAVGSLTDITERKRTEAALRQSEAKNRAMLAAIPDLLLRVKRDGTCLDFIPPRDRNAGEFIPIRNHLAEVLPPDLLQHQLERIAESLATGALQIWEHQLPKNGRLCAEEVRLIPCGDDEVLVIVRDISERKQAEEMLRRYERIVSATTDAILLLDRNYTYQVVNQAYLDWYDRREEEISGHPVTDLLSLEVFENTVKPRLDQCLAGQVVQFEMWADYPKMGRQFLSVTYDPYYDANQVISGVVVSLRNITRLKQAETELELQGVIVRNMAEGICVVRADSGIVVYANPKFERLFGYSPGELKDQHISVVNHSNETLNAAEVNQSITQAVMQHGEATYEVHNVKKDGTPFWCRATTSIFQHPEHGTVMVAVQQDITEQKRAEQQIQASLREKEVLLKEIHHRVKNNLGIVDGLLQMQARRSPDPRIVEILKESQNRISSIALVHEKLYGSEDLANIDFAQYIADLTAHLFDSYNIRSGQIQLITHIENLSLDIDAAIPCGLIINELVSNALKYAFPNSEAGEIRVSFQQQQNQTLVLSVHDNGMGLPHDFDLNQTRTLGISLVRGLVRQLRGTLEIGTQQGTTFTISFDRTEHAANK